MAYSMSMDAVSASVRPRLESAEMAAINSCRSTGMNNPQYQGDCQGAVWVNNGYAAVAVHRQDNAVTAWGGGWGSSADRASQEAINRCENQGMGSCLIRENWEINPGPGAIGGSWGG
ncbi:DUF4189 domain-containing protein [Amycolatopsis taiwanensis]|uniref:DUF4189 domain-containing protein n=1 Tax=Amycolatopsis taiwanensis TaxID=342230 RepID=A0A9W6QUH6_9PSEU|nr:DUF4189 domain-containing protein [Amycolatopsis taiwanensis]GLY64414.1 hypothetical protein Atai01_10330 [Amycolatopsis taiwanensis]